MVKGALQALLELARLITSAGTTASGALLAAGLVLFVVGFRGYRIAAALVGAAVVAFAIGYWHIRIASSPAFARAIGGLVAACAGLIWPGSLTITSMGLLGLALSGVLFRRYDSETRLMGATLLTAAGIIFPAMFYAWLPALVVPPVAASLFTLGAWGLFGQSHAASALYKVPAAWLLLAGLLTVVGWIVENARLTQVMLGPEGKKGPKFQGTPRKQG